MRASVFGEDCNKGERYEDWVGVDILTMLDTLGTLGTLGTLRLHGYQPCQSNGPYFRRHRRCTGRPIHFILENDKL